MKDVDLNTKSAKGAFITGGTPLKDAEYFHLKAPKLAKELKAKLNMNTWLAVLLSVVTIGYFAVYLQYKLTKLLTKENFGEKNAAINDRLNMQCALLVGLALMNGFFDLAWLVSGFEVTNLFTCLIFFTFIAVHIFWSLTAGNVLKAYCSTRLNITLTPQWGLLVLFGCFKVTYLINNLASNPQLKK